MLGEHLAGRDIARAHLAGNPLGGAIARCLAEAGLARSVTAFSPAGGWPSGRGSHRYGAPLLEHVPEPDVIRLRGVGHVPMYDDPALVAAVIAAFVERTQGGRAEEPKRTTTREEGSL
jgi:pimeloyl-ACP methyl ester carboxylesterase